MEDLGEIVGEFLMESHENLDQIDRDLVALEQEPQSRELISRIFRAIHTIKGTSGFLAFTRLETLAHAGESLLSRLRDGVQPVTPTTITTLLATIDGVRVAAGGDRAGRQPRATSTSTRIITAVHAQMNAPGRRGRGRQRRRAPAAAAEQPEPLDEKPVRPAPEPVEEQRRPLGEMLVETGAAAPERRRLRAAAAARRRRAQARHDPARRGQGRSRPRSTRRCRRRPRSAASPTARSGSTSTCSTA